MTQGETDGSRLGAATVVISPLSLLRRRRWPDGKTCEETIQFDEVAGERPRPIHDAVRLDSGRLMQWIRVDSGPAWLATEERADIRR